MGLVQVDVHLGQLNRLPLEDRQQHLPAGTRAPGLSAHLSTHQVQHLSPYLSPADLPQGLLLHSWHNLCLGVDAKVEPQGEALCAGVLGEAAAAHPGVPPTEHPSRGANALRLCACAEPSSWAASVPSSSAPCGCRVGRVTGMPRAGDVEGRAKLGAHPLLSAGPSSSSSMSEAGLVRGGHERVDMLRARMEPAKGHGTGCAVLLASRRLWPHPTPAPAPALSASCCRRAAGTTVPARLTLRVQVEADVAVGRHGAMEVAVTELTQAEGAAAAQSPALGVVASLWAQVSPGTAAQGCRPQQAGRGTGSTTPLLIPNCCWHRSWQCWGQSGHRESSVSGVGPQAVGSAPQGPPCSATLSEDTRKAA